METKNLIIQTAFIGDVLLSIPLIKNLKSEFPNQKLVYYCRKGLGDFLLKTGLVDEVIEVDKNSKSSIALAEKKLIKDKYNFVISPHESLRTFILLFKISAKKKIGFKNWWNPIFLDACLPRDLSLHDVQRQLSLLSLLSSGFKAKFDDFIKTIKENKKVTRLSPRSYKVYSHIPYIFSQNFKEKALYGKGSELRSEISSEIKKIALAPGSTWATKKWPLKKYIELAKLLDSKNYDILLIGSPEEASLCEEIEKIVPNVKNYSGKLDLYSSYKKLSEVDLLISNDSGAMHLGALSNIKIVSIFGPTIPEYGYTPWVENYAIIEENLDCRPCGKHGAKECPIGTHACMENIPAQEVFNLISQV